MEVSKPSEVPQTINPLLEAYLGLLEKELPGFVTGFYLHGSIALGAFDPKLSDIDFIAVISRLCAKRDFETLAGIHQKLAQREDYVALQGSYLGAQNLGEFETPAEPYPHFDGGKLSLRERIDIDWVTWWLLKNRGVCLMGTSPTELSFSVEWDRLLAEMGRNLNTYWRGFIRDPRRMVWLLSDYGIQWAVLGVLRQFYTFNEHGISSKVGAGEYALKHLPEKWHRIIQEALNIRGHVKPSLYHFRASRALEAVNFLEFVIRFCNNQPGWVKHDGL
jgi:hypothetical protein